MEPLLPIECERARRHVSLQLDGELSEVGRARLSGHLAVCPACRRFAAHAESAADVLRGSPLEQPELPVMVPTRRRPAARAFQLSAAAAGVVAALALTTLGGVGQRQQFGASSSATGSESEGLRSPEEELRLLHRAAQPRVAHQVGLAR